MRDREVVYEENKDGLTLQVVADDTAESPRENGDFLGTLVCWHRRHVLGDKQPKQSPREYFSELIGHDLGEGREFRVHEEPALLGCALLLPLYLYDHSGITMRCTPFSCPWDSGQVGYVYATHKDICDNWSVKCVEDEVTGHKGEKLTALEYAKRLLVAEVEEYDYWLRGSVYFWRIKDEEGEQLDSCGGYYGDPAPEGMDPDGGWHQMLSDARGSLQACLDGRAKKKAQKLKACIKHKVPIDKRELAEKGA